MTQIYSRLLITIFCVIFSFSAIAGSIPESNYTIQPWRDTKEKSWRALGFMTIAVQGAAQGANNYYAQQAAQQQAYYEQRQKTYTNYLDTAPSTEGMISSRRAGGYVPITTNKVPYINPRQQQEQMKALAKSMSNWSPNTTSSKDIFFLPSGHIERHKCKVC